MDSKAKKGFRYETHLHTSEASQCAEATGAEMVQAHLVAGYSGMIVTDHFFNGNCAISNHYPWEERVRRFCMGYDSAVKEATHTPFKVFFGWEYNYMGTEFLTYGLDRQFLLNHPDMLSWPLLKYFDKVHEQGGFISHAHPFREASYIAELRLFPEYVDAVEVVNLRNDKPAYDKKALEYAKRHGLYQTQGSDTHKTAPLGGGGMVFDYELQTIQDFIRAVKLR